MPPMTEHRVTEHPAEQYRGIYTQPYSEIVQPGRVWTVSKYFLRRWAAYLTPAEMWLVIGARQLSYLNRRRPWFAAYDSTLAAAAGLNVDVYRRTVKRAIAEEEGFVSRFLGKEADPAYVVRDGAPRKGRTRYTIRLDDPLTPADAEALAAWLRERLSADAGEIEVAALLQQARLLEPQTLWAEQPSRPQQPDLPLTVEGIVLHVLPHLEERDRQAECNEVPQGYTEILRSEAYAEDDGRSEHSAQDDKHDRHAECNEASSGWRAAADALHTHLVAGEIVHIEPQYFREQWLPELGTGPALLLVTLRSLCYLNEETGEIRDVVSAEAHELAERLQTTTRTLRRWFKKLERAAAHDTLFGPFFTFLESSKQADQKVIATYRVNLKMPLTREALSRYHASMFAGGQVGGDLPKNGMLADKKSVTNRRQRQKVPDEKSVTQPVISSVTDKRSATSLRVADKTSATVAGAGQEVGYETPGSGQMVGRSQTKGRRFNYYKRLLSVLNLKDLKQLEQSTEQQYQHLWHVSDGQAQEPFAAVAAGGALAELPDLLGIQEPARSRILQRGAAPSELLAWHLYAQRQSNLDQPLGYVVARALAGDNPPQPFLDLASLSWEQWRAYAAVAFLAPHVRVDSGAFAETECFPEWVALYGDVPPDRLPFQVGAGLSDFRIVLEEEVEGLETRTPTVPPEADTGADPQGAARALWQETLSELSLQMTQSTFDAWLRDAHFVSRDEDAWVIAVASPAAQSWLQNRLCGVVERTLGVVVGEAVSVRFEVGSI